MWFFIKITWKRGLSRHKTDELILKGFIKQLCMNSEIPCTGGDCRCSEMSPPSCDKWTCAWLLWYPWLLSRSRPSFFWKSTVDWQWERLSSLAPAGPPLRMTRGGSRHSWARSWSLALRSTATDSQHWLHSGRESWGSEAHPQTLKRFFKTSSDNIDFTNCPQTKKNIDEM